MRQWIGSTFSTCKGQLALERHGGRSILGVRVRIAMRMLALAAGLLHNQQIGDQPPLRRLRPLIRNQPSSALGFATRSRIRRERDWIVEQANGALALEDPWEAIRTFLESYFEQQATDRGLREYLLGHRGGTELARRARERVLPVVSVLVVKLTRPEGCARTSAPATSP